KLPLMSTLPLSGTEFYSRQELLDVGFEHVGIDVRVSRKASLYQIKGIIGSNVRVDDFTILKGRVVIGSYVHVAAHCLVSAMRGVVTLSDFCTLSDCVRVFSGFAHSRATALASG